MGAGRGPQLDTLGMASGWGDHLDCFIEPHFVAVTGLAFEARIAAGPGVRVICSGDGRNLAAKLTAAIADAREHVQGCPGIISFGVAGGLAPQLRPGTCVVGSAVISGENRMPISPEFWHSMN